MWQNSQETADLDTFIEEMRNGKLHFLCSGWITWELPIGESIKWEKQDDRFDFPSSASSSRSETRKINVI